MLLLVGVFPRQHANEACRGYTAGSAERHTFRMHVITLHEVWCGAVRKGQRGNTGCEHQHSLTAPLWLWGLWRESCRPSAAQCQVISQEFIYICQILCKVTLETHFFWCPCSFRNLFLFQVFFALFLHLFFFTLLKIKIKTTFNTCYKISALHVYALNLLI